MRERYLEAFDHVWIDCLNGDKYKTGKLTPDGKPDPSIFSTEFNREGIQVGTAITLLARTSPSKGAKSVRFRHLWGKEKRDRLLAESTSESTPKYDTVRPSMPLGLPFVPSRVGSAYLSWPLLPEIFPVSFPGVKTSRDDVVVDIDREKITARMEAYFDPADLVATRWHKYAPRAMEDAAGFSARQTRRYLLKRGFKPENVVRFSYRPFDVRWLYWEPETKLLDREASGVLPARVSKGTCGSARSSITARSSTHPLSSSRLCSLHVIERGANMFPLLLNPEHSLLDAHESDQPRPNISATAAEYLRTLGAGAADLFHHLLAVLYAPSYSEENSSALRSDWPRIPLPASKPVLVASAALGREVAALLDPEGALPNVAKGLKSVGLLTAAKVRSILTPATWNSRQAGATPGRAASPCRRRARSRLREMTPGERGAMPEGAIAILGDETCDVWLNERAYWRNIPLRVWEYTLGGYQVIKKWLSYREKELLNRSLTVEEARYVTEMARRIAAILLTLASPRRELSRRDAGDLRTDQGRGGMKGRLQSAERAGRV